MCMFIMSCSGKERLSTDIYKPVSSVFMNVYNRSCMSEQSSVDCTCCFYFVDVGNFWMCM
jgi:hypothetical protein